MNLINRLIIIIELLLILGAGLFLVLTSIHLINPETFWFYPALKQFVGDLGHLERGMSLRFLVTGFVLIAFSLIFLVFEIFPADKDETIVLEESESGKIEIDKSGFLSIIERIGLSFPGVLSFKPKVKISSKGRDVSLVIKCYVEPNLNLVELGDSMQQKIEDQVKNRLGIDIKECSIRFKVKKSHAPVNEPEIVMKEETDYNDYESSPKE